MIKKYIITASYEKSARIYSRVDLLQATITKFPPLSQTRMQLDKAYFFI